MSMAKKKPRWKSQFIADAYHFLLEELDDKINYKVGYTTFDEVWVTYYDCYTTVHCKLKSTGEKIKVIFATKKDDYVYVHTKSEFEK
jgi:hypothetical protein